MRPPPRDAEEIGSNRCCSPDHKSVMGLDGGGGEATHTVSSVSSSAAETLPKDGHGGPAYLPRRSAAGERAPAVGLRRGEAWLRGSGCLCLSLSWPRGLEEAAGDWGSGGVQCGLAVRVESEEIVRPCVGTGWPTSQAGANGG